MSLRSKVAIIVMGIFLFYATVDFGIQRFIIFPSFLSLEQEEAVKDSKRVLQAIHREIHHLDSIVYDWASWDDTYAFVESLSSHYIEANLPITTFTDNNLNLIYICDKNGKVIWGEIHDLETEAKIRVENFPKDRLPKTHPLISYETKNKPLSDETVSGVYMTPNGPMIIASRPILNIINEGPSRGSFIMGRFLTPPMVKTLADQTQVDFQIFPVQTDSIPEHLRGILTQLTDKSPYLIETNKDDDQMQVYTAYPDIKGNTALLIKSGIPRKITAQGFATIHYAMLSDLVAGLGALIVLLLLLKWAIVKPIARLTGHAMEVRKTGDLSKQLSSQRQDEIGILAGEFDDMLIQLGNRSDELEALNTKLQEDLDKRRQAEEALRESEEKYRTLVENANSIILKMDTQGNITLFNEFARKFFGYSEKEIIGVNVVGTIVPSIDSAGNDLAAMIADIGKHAEQYVNNENENILRNGMRVWVAWTNKPIFDEKGNITEILCIGNDITERKRAEEALQESEKKYSNLFDSTPIPTVSIDKTGNILDINKSHIEQIAGGRHKAENYIGMNILTHPSIEKAGVFELYGKALEGEFIEAEQVYFPEVTRGTEGYFNVKASPIFDKDGDISSIIVTHDEVTERKLAQDALQKSEERYRLITETAREGIYQVDISGKIVYVNEAHAQMLGYECAEILGKHYSFIFPDNNLSEANVIVETVYSGTPQRGEITMKHKLGKDFQAYYSMVPIKQNREITGFTGILEDITQLKQAEHLIRELHHKLLESQENERQIISRELHDRVAQDLSAIKISCEMLLEYNSLSANIRNHISGISAKLHEILKAVRDLSYDLRPSGLEELGLIETLNRYCKDFSSDNGVHVDFFSAGVDNLKMKFEANINLYRLVQEGLNNVRKHADADHITIKLISSFPNIILRIEDDGKGFDTETRLTAAYKEKRMGIRSMKERVGLLQGKMRIESIPGMGTKILIEIPHKDQGIQGAGF